MKESLQTKFLAICLLLVVLTTVGLSVTYLTFTRQDKHLESQERIQIGFDIILSDMSDRLAMYRQRVEELLQQHESFSLAASAYLEDPSSQLKAAAFLTTFLPDAADDLKHFGHGLRADRLELFAADGRLLLAYRQQGAVEHLGAYLISEEGGDTYLPMDDRKAYSPILQSAAVPQSPLPEMLPTAYTEEFPQTISVNLTNIDDTPGFRILAPIEHNGQRSGLLVADIFYTQGDIERYAAMSKTEINIFVRDLPGVGTLPQQMQFTEQELAQMPACDDMLTRQKDVEVLPFTFDGQDYYQGQCALNEGTRRIGALTVSLTQEREKAGIRKMWFAVLQVSAVCIGAAFLLSWLLSRKAIHSIRHIAGVLGGVASGDLRRTSQTFTRDELGMLAAHVNRMIQQLRNMYEHIQHAALTVNTTSDVILEEMRTLTGRMEQQSTTVDNTTEFVEQIAQFINDIGASMNEQMLTAEQVLSSSQQIRASIEEVTSSTEHLAENTQHIGSSIEQVNRSVRHISESAEFLGVAAQETETEIHHIDESLKDVSQNTARSQELAKDTMSAVQSGQRSVNASIQGMQELKNVISQSSEIILEVNTSSVEISSILDMVDDIAEQTSLLSLNASIISAQAGEHGKGFAVVASEIKELAQRTKSSTMEINTLVRTLQENARESVASIDQGIKKADQGVQLVSAVKEDLTTILEKATRTSTMATDTVKLVNQTTESSQAIKSSMTMLSEMVMNITNAIQEQERDISQIVTAIDTMQEMSSQVNQANREQNRATTQIVGGMEYMAANLSDVSTQSKNLKQSAEQILTAMHTIELIGQTVLADAIKISGSTSDNMAIQVELLKRITTMFKVS